MQLLYKLKLTDVQIQLKTKIVLQIKKLIFGYMINCLKQVHFKNSQILNKLIKIRYLQNNSYPLIQFIYKKDFLRIWFYNKL